MKTTADSASMTTIDRAIVTAMVAAIVKELRSGTRTPASVLHKERKNGPKRTAA